MESKVNLCAAVRQSCRDWYEQQAEVRINSTACLDLAKEILEQPASNIEWDEEGWHYHPPKVWPENVRNERIALYILALDAINFCFWTCPDFEYEHLATRLTVAAERDHDIQAHYLGVVPEYAFSAHNLQHMTVPKMQSILGLGDDLFLWQERCALWNQVGRVLIQKFKGSAWNLIQAADSSAVTAAQLLFENFDGFQDQHVVCSTDSSSSSKIFFLKRAQICVADWHAALGLSWPDINKLTTFSDYRLPQLLRQRGVLEYSKELADQIDSQQELKMGSLEEVSIRAAVVVAVDELVQTLNKQQEQDCPEYTAVSVDWYLWQVGERLDAAGELAPHHRVRTIYY